jgi:putative hydrolase of the HAD superfamily
MPDANLTSADQNPDAITLPRAILFDLDDTILAAGQRLEVLRLVAREFEPELEPLQPDDVAEWLDAVLAEFWSDSVRHKIARFRNIPSSPAGDRRRVYRHWFGAHDRGTGRAFCS